MLFDGLYIYLGAQIAPKCIKIKIGTKLFIAKYDDCMWM